MTSEQEKRLFTLFHGHAHDSLTEIEHTELQSLLRADAEARRLWFVHQDIEMGLHAGLLEAPAIPTVAGPKGRSRWLQWRPAAAAAAGLLVGAVTASLAWALATPKVVHERELPLVDGSFEQTVVNPPLYIPRKFGLWAGDPVEVVAEFGGIKPHSGQRMVRYMASAARKEYRPLSNASDLWQVISLPGLGPRVVRVRAWFNAVGPASFTIGAVAGAEGPETAVALWNDRLKDDPKVLAAGMKTFGFTASTPGWQMGELLIQVPETARVLVIDVAAHRMPGSAVNDGFPGQFVDDVSVTIADEPAVP